MFGFGFKASRVVWGLFFFFGGGGGRGVYKLVVRFVGRLAGRTAYDV